MINKDNFNEQRTYDAVAVDNEIAILEQSRNFWKKKYKEQKTELEIRRKKIVELQKESQR